MFNFFCILCCYASFFLIFYSQVSLLTIDVISNTAFGIDVQAQTKLGDNQFVDNVLRITGGFNAAQASLLEQIRVNVAIQAESMCYTIILYKHGLARFARNRPIL